ncbi:MAG: class I SAM-dependent methyltransferase [candidate division KSB1 bacterium]
MLVAEHFSRYKFCAPLVPNKLVLDAACGTGFGAHMLALAGARHVDAIDISPEAVGIAQRHYTHPQISFNVCDIISFQASFGYDVVVSFETIEHISESEKYLRVVQNALKPGGVFLVSTPNRAVSNPKATRFEAPKNPFHVTEWTLAEFGELLRGYFDVKEVYGQRSYYYKGTKIRTFESIVSSKRLRDLLHLPEADYEKPSQVRPLKPWYEPVFLVAWCQKRAR